MMRYVWCTVMTLCLCSTAMADPAAVFAQLWPDVAYAQGTTAMLLIPQGGPTPDVWTVQLVDTQDINNPIVLAEATLAVDSRFTFLYYDPSVAQLQQAGLNDMRTETIAAFFSSPAAGQIVLYGFTKHIERPAFTAGDPPIVFDGFGALGITPDLATAVAKATDLSMAILPSPATTGTTSKDGKLQIGVTSLNLKESLTNFDDAITIGNSTATSQPLLTGNLDCVKQNENCLKAAELRRKSQILVCTSASLGGVTACALPSAGCFAGIGACYLVCVGVIYVGEIFCMESAELDAQADIIDCGSDYNVCCSENPCPPNE